MAFSSSNKNSASARESSVLPTPVGPRKMNEPIGRFSSCKPARARRTAFDTALIASSWPMTRCMQALFHLHEFLALAFLQTRDRNVRPARDDLGDVFLGHFFAEQLRFLVPASSFAIARCSLRFELGNAAVLDLARLGQLAAALRAFELGARGCRAAPSACAVRRSPAFSFCHSAFSADDFSFRLGQFLFQLLQPLLARRHLSPSSTPGAPSRAA